MVSRMSGTPRALLQHKTPESNKSVEVLCPYGFTGQKHGIYGRMSIFKFPKINALSMILPNSVESAIKISETDKERLLGALSN